MADQMVADEAGAQERQSLIDDDVIVITEIDLGFAPRPREDLKTVAIGDELVLYERSNEVLFVLDKVGAVVWGFFDGEVTLGEIADDFAAVSDQVSLEQVQEDLLFLAKRLGSAGLLHKVTTPSQRTEALGTYVVGDELPPFSLEDMNGDEVDITSLRGHQVLLVNWSPTCGFCLRIAPELAELQPLLDEKGVELVLLSNGSPEENQEVFDANGLHVRTLLEPDYYEDLEDDEDEEGEHIHDHGDGEGHDHGEASVASGEGEDGLEDDLVGDDEDDYRDPFPAMGTPVAYLLDVDGKVAQPLATGATAVPALARFIAGVEPETEELPADGRYLNLEQGETCGPGGGSGKSPRVWAATGAYLIADYRVGVKADSMETEGTLERFLASVRMPEGTRAPGDYALVLGDGGVTKRGLNLVMQGTETVVRTRSPRRALLGLAGYLSTHLDQERPDFLRVSAMGVIMDGEAVILPADVNGWLDELQPRLAKLGGAPIDLPYLTIDVARREVVVPEPALALDTSVLDDYDEPPPRRSERPRVEPGRYPLRRWLIWQSNEEEPLTRAQLVTRAMAATIETQTNFDATLESIDALRADGTLFPFDFMYINEFMLRLPLAAAGEPHDHLEAPTRDLTPKAEESEQAQQPEPAEEAASA